MSTYKLITSIKGDRYLKDGKLVGKDKIPGFIHKRLVLNQEISDEKVPFTIPVKQCIFCDAYTKHCRVVNAQTIYVCEQHYYSESVGKTVQQLREREQAYERSVQKERSEETQEEQKILVTG